MKEYIKPEIEYVEFLVEPVADVSMGTEDGIVDDGNL